MSNKKPQIKLRTITSTHCDDCEEQHLFTDLHKVGDRLLCDNCLPVKEFEISYSYKTFTDKIGAGVLAFEADDLKAIQQLAFEVVMNQLKESWEYEDRPWYEGFQNLSITIHEKDNGQ